jgi:hypothetical protein
MIYRKNFNEYAIKENYTEIYVVQRNKTKHVILIDTLNLNKLLGFSHRWHVRWHKNAHRFYACATIYSKDGSKDMLMHSFLFDRQENEVLDHINGNGLDNRDENIRPCSEDKNLKNRNGRNKNNKSGYRNVVLVSGYYRIQLQINGKNHRFPEKFSDVDDAGKFAEKMRLQYYGEFAGNS